MTEPTSQITEDVFLREILEQPAALRACLRHWLQDQPAQVRLVETLKDHKPALVVFTGMGSSMNACYPAKAFLNHHGLASVVIETAELLYYGTSLLAPGNLLVVVSQSGESIEPVRLMNSLPAGCPVISLTNGLDNTIARKSTLALDMHAGPEQTVSTKTYTCAHLSLFILVNALAGSPSEANPRELESLLAAFESLLEEWKSRVQPLVDLLRPCPYVSLVGRGPSLATALDGAQMLKEAAHWTAEAASGGQFRHGPMELVSGASGYILFPGSRLTRDLMARLGKDISGHGARVAFIGGSRPEADDAVWFPLPTDHDYLLPMLEIVPIQLLAWYLARLDGRTVNSFERMTKVVRTE